MEEKRLYDWKYLLLAGATLLVAALACGPRPEVTPTPEGTPIGEVTIAPPPSETPAVLPTDTPQAPIATETPALSPTPTTCAYNAAFVDDVTVPDGTEFAPGAAFTKTWRLRNSGCLNWPAGTRLIFVRGERLGGPDSVAAPAASIGNTVDVSVALTAPAAAGAYRGYWQLETPDGTRFGPQIFVDIKVVVGPTATPTATSEPQTLILTMQPSPLTGDVSSAGCGAQMRAGIAPAGNGIRGLTSFDISALHGKTIVTATLDLSDYVLDGNPFALEPLIVEQVAFGNVCGEYPNTYNTGNEITRLARFTESSALAMPVDVKAALSAHLGGSPAPQYFQIRIRWRNDDAGAPSASMIRWPTMRLIVVYLP